MRTFILLNLILPFLLPHVCAACSPNTTNTAGLQSLLQSGGAGYTLQLCQGQIYNITSTLNYTAANQVSGLMALTPASGVSSTVLG